MYKLTTLRNTTQRKGKSTRIDKALTNCCVICGKQLKLCRINAHGYIYCQEFCINDATIDSIACFFPKNCIELYDS